MKRNPVVDCGADKSDTCGQRVGQRPAQLFPEQVAGRVTPLPDPEDADGHTHLPAKQAVDLGNCRAKQVLTVYSGNSVADPEAHLNTVQRQGNKVFSKVGAGRLLPRSSRQRQKGPRCSFGQEIYRDLHLPQEILG